MLCLWYLRSVVLFQRCLSSDYVASTSSKAREYIAKNRVQGEGQGVVALFCRRNTFERNIRRSKIDQTVSLLHILWQNVPTEYQTATLVREFPIVNVYGRVNFSLKIRR